MSIRNRKKEKKISLKNESIQVGQLIDSGQYSVKLRENRLEPKACLIKITVLLRYGATAKAAASATMK